MNMDMMMDERFLAPDRKHALEREGNGIATKLARYISKDQAKQIAGELMDMAFDIDRMVRTIRAHPAVKAKYKYDGHMFSLGEADEGVIIWDGLRLLQDLNSENKFNNYRDKQGAFDYAILADQMKEHKKIAEDNLDALKHYGDIGIDREFVRNVQ